MSTHSIAMKAPDQRAQNAPKPMPNFFIVGAPKCATTAMDSYLAQHPQIYMSPAKETHFYAHDLYPDAIRCSAERYESLFKDAGDYPVIGESSVFYMLSHTAAQAIYQTCPQAKILFMLRNPVDLLQSHHSQIVFEGLETETNFENALQLEKIRKAKQSGSALTFQERVLHYRDIVKFHDQIKRYLDVFPREQLHFVLYDDIQKNLPEVYKSILTFLGVNVDIRPTFDVENANKELRSKEFGEFLRNTPDWFTRISRILLPSAAFRYRARMFLKRLNTHYKKRPEMSAKLRGRLTEEFRPDIEKLSALLNRDLSHWYRPSRANDEAK